MRGRTHRIVSLLSVFCLLLLTSCTVQFDAQPRTVETSQDLWRLRRSVRVENPEYVAARTQWERELADPYRDLNVLEHLVTKLEMPSSLGPAFKPEQENVNTAVELLRVSFESTQNRIVTLHRHVETTEYGNAPDLTPDQLRASISDIHLMIQGLAKDTDRANNMFSHALMRHGAHLDVYDQVHETPIHRYGSQDPGETPLRIIRVDTPPVPI